MGEDATHAGGTRDNETVPDPSAKRRPRGETTRGSQFGRYIILDELGRGGMGVVFSAYDHVLDRKVALKVLTGRSDIEGADLLLTEAQAMAKLSHPNVVTVYEVGEREGAVFIAMEFVDGTTLRKHIEETAPDGATKLGLLREIGAGLAAAHGAGVIHRDLKPDNVLVGTDGRCRIADFGLAKSAGTAQLASPIADDHGAGTPGYMSPEQDSGQHTDERTDQYAFAIMGIEMLTGSRERPTLDALTKHVPARAARALLRGASAERVDRFPSIAALLAELAPPRRALRWLIAGGVVVTGVIVTLVATRTTVVEAPELRCDEVAAQIGTTWSARDRPALETAVNAMFPANVSQKLVGDLDAWAALWRSTAKTSCEDTKSGRQAPALHSTRMGCLDLARSAVNRILRDLMGGDPARVSHAAGVASLELANLESCTRNDELLGWEPMLPRGRAEEVEALSREIWDVSLLGDAGKFDEARPKYAALIERVRERGFVPLLAQLHHYRAMMENLAGNYDEAAAAAFETIAISERYGAGGFATAAWVELVSIQDARGRWRDALAAETIAQARLSRRGRTDELAVAVLQGSRANILATHGQAAEALPLARAEAAYFAKHPEDVRNNVVAHQHLAWAFVGIGKFPEARQELATASELAKQLPPEMPALAILASQRVWVELAARDGQAALDAVTHALTFPENAEDTMLVWAKPQARLLLGQAAEARTEAVAAVEQLAPLGAISSDLQHAWYVLGLIERELGHRDQAAALFQRALDGLGSVPVETRSDISFLRREELEAALASVK